MNQDYLLQQIRDEIRRGPRERSLATTVTHVLSREGVDLRLEPSLEAMKHLLVEAARAANERQCTAC